MALTATQLDQGVELLKEAIRAPFFRLDDDERPIQGWFTFLVEYLPLSTFQTDAYLRLGNPDLPTTWPLKRILLSVLADEGWQGWHFRGEDDTPYQLVYNLTARREELGRANERFFSSCLVTEDGDGGIHIKGAYDLRWLTEPDVIVDWDDEGPVGTHTVYEEIGRELVARIDVRDAAPPGSDEARQAQEAIDDFLREISARRGRGRPPRGADDDTLSALYEEAVDVLEIVSRSRQVGPSAETKDILTQNAITEPGDQAFWAALLALPTLSARELTAVRRYLGQDNWLTPRRLGILFLAGRLRLEAPHLARRVVGADEQEEFRNKQGRYDV